MKALRAGLGEVAPVDIEVVTGASGALDLDLHRTALRAARKQAVADWALSLTYAGNWALALAVALNVQRNAAKDGPHQKASPAVATHSAQEVTR